MLDGNRNFGPAFEVAAFVSCCECSGPHASHRTSDLRAVVTSLEPRKIECVHMRIVCCIIVLSFLCFAPCLIPEVIALGHSP
jgi:hypothetical protein